MKTFKLFIGTATLFSATLAFAEPNTVICESKDKTVQITYSTTNMFGTPGIAYKAPAKLASGAIDTNIQSRDEVLSSKTNFGEIVGAEVERKVVSSSHITTLHVALFIPVMVGEPTANHPFEFDTLATLVQRETYTTARVLGPQAQIVGSTAVHCVAEQRFFAI